MIARLRDATREDAALLFEWANEPAVRAASFQHGPIEWASHAAWLDAGLSDAARFRLFIAEDASETPIGQVRFEREAGAATLSYSIARQQRGRGLATPLIRCALERIRADWRALDSCTAEVRPDNVASARALSRADFRLQDTREDRAVFVWSAPHDDSEAPLDPRRG